MDDPLIDKMQALMGKYQQPAVSHGAAPAQNSAMLADSRSGFPVLTDIVQLGDAVFHSTLADPPAPESEPSAITLHNDSANQIAQQVLDIIDAQLQQQVDMLVTPRLQRAMDEVLATLLPQLIINIESIVHETLIKEFSRHGIPLKNTNPDISQIDAPPRLSID